MKSNIPPRPFFHTATRQTQLRAEALSWLDTPFVPHARIKRAGVDCIGLVAGIYLTTGFLRAFSPPPYAMDGGKHNAVSQLTAWLDQRPDFAPVARGQEMAGDVICFKLGLSAHHTGLMTDHVHFVCCLFKRQVSAGTLKDGIYKRIYFAAYRPMEVSP